MRSEWGWWNYSSAYTRASLKHVFSHRTPDQTVPLPVRRWFYHVRQHPTPWRHPGLPALRPLLVQALLKPKPHLKPSGLLMMARDPARACKNLCHGWSIRPVFPKMEDDLRRIKHFKRGLGSQALQKQWEGRWLPFYGNINAYTGKINLLPLC